MKTKHVLLLPVMLLLTVVTTIAQDATNMQPASREIIPFGEKLPPPATTLSKAFQYMAGSGANTALMPRVKDLSANIIKQNPKLFMQQMQERKDNLIRLNQRYRNTAPGIENGKTENSDFHLTKDINVLTDANPNNVIDFKAHPSYAILNDVMYFAADDGIHGRELWRCDGTGEGTYLVKDIAPGELNAAPFNITAVNGKLYFSAYTTENGYEPWVSDGTNAGTHLLKEILPGVADGYPNQFISLGNKVYFVTNTEFSSWGALWTTDGTTAGTNIVKNIGEEGSGGSFISQVTVANGLLFFTSINYGTYSWELWRSDGTHSGTYHVGTGATFTDVPSQLTSYNQQLYFAANEGSGRKLWISDGTDTGTTPAQGNKNVIISPDYFGVNFPILNNAMYIPCVTATQSSALYKYNAASPVMVKVKDFTKASPAGSIIPLEMVVADNTLYFKISSADGSQQELWASKGSNENTQPVQKFREGESIYNLYDGGGRLYFARVNKLLGAELWTTVNTPLGITPVPVTDIFRGETSSYPLFITPLKGKVFFCATDDEKGAELFTTGGSILSTSLVKDINITTTSSSNAGMFLFDGTITSFGNAVVFNAFENVHGSELYRSDGTEHGTQMLNDIVHGQTGSAPARIMSKNGYAYFIANSNNNSYALYKTDGTKKGLQKITPDYDHFQYNIPNFDVADNGLVFYVVFNWNSFMYELWRSDGTDAGTIILTSTVYYSNALHTIGNTAFFVAGDDAHGYELWTSDGSVASTSMVKDINAGTGSSAPGGLFVYKNEVYFGAYDGINQSFWKSDGTAGGTVKLKNIDPWWGGDPEFNKRFFAVSNGILYFTALDYSTGNGTELWRTDGTTEGTQPVKDINPTNNERAVGAYYLTDINGTLFFTDDDGVHGRELWKSDGTEEGTTMVVDLTPGTEWSNVWNLINYAGKLYFTNNNYLWSSDGTESGTEQVNDRGISDVFISNMITSGGKLFMSGNAYKYGWELYVGKVDNETNKMIVQNMTTKHPTKTSLPFDAIVYPNPASTNAKLRITGDVKHVAVSITDLNGKRLWQSNNVNAMLINLPVEKLASGTYFVTVTSGSESQTIKLIKQ